MSLQFIARPGLPSGGTAATQALDLFLKKYTGEVLTTFKETNVMRQYTKRRTITAGRSAQFLGIGNLTAAYHTIGDNILIDSGYLQTPKQGEKLIHIDKELLSAVVIPNIEEAMAQYDYRAPMSMGQGRALALQYDKALLRVGVLGSRGTTGTPVANVMPVNPTSGGSWSATGGLANAALDAADPGGAATAAIGTATVALAVVAAQTFDEREIPRENRYFAVTPVVYWSLVLNKELINRDYNGDGNGVFYDGRVWRCAGFQLIMTNNLPNSNESSSWSNKMETDEGNTYGADFSLTKGLFWHEGALATVELLGLKMEQEYKIELRGTLMVASYAVGHGFLRSDSLIELQSVA